VMFPGQRGGVPGAGQFPGQQPGAGGNTGPGGAANSFGSVTNSFGTSNSFGGASTPPAGVNTGRGMPGQQPGQAIYPGQGLPGQAVAPVNPQAGGSPYPPAAGVNGAAAVPNQPGVGGSPQNSQAADMINRILTSPRPGGMPTGAQTGGAGLGNGIAGVASNAEGDSIMVYNDHTKYEEWEFIFDPQKQRQI